MQSHKPQFAGWLIEQVETGQYKGLRYVTKNSFRVPWKHNSRRDCCDEDNKIFRAWAEASGKINENPDDKAKWKTNFRCALNNLKKHFKMVLDNSKNSEDPHKVYEIIHKEYDYEMPVQVAAPFIEAYDMPPVIYNSLSSTVPTNMENDDLLKDMITLDLNSQHPEWADSYSQPDAVVPGTYPQQVVPGTYAQQVVPGTYAQQVVPGSYPHIQAIPQAVSQTTVDRSPMEVTPEAPPMQPSMQPSINDLEVTISYRQREVLKTAVSSPRVQLHYFQASDPNAHPICFPDTDKLVDHKQVEYTNRILSSIQRGLFLDVRNDGIYGYREDKCHVFASTSDPRVAHPKPEKLPPNSLVQLLSFEKYLADLRAFQESRGGSPEYTINMCFGEKFPDGKALEKKLVVVKVVPLICRYYHEMAQMEGASSLHNDNISLQISHSSSNSLFDLISASFSLPTAADIPQPGGLF